MSKIVTSKSEIPDAPFYVLANDNFLSGWGPAEGKINTIILPCISAEEAAIVEENTRNRSEMKRIRLIAKKPALRRGVLYSLMSREMSARWYEPGAWR